MQSFRERLDRVGKLLVDGFQMIGLFILGATIAWAAVYEYIGMIQQGYARLDGILLLFIYLELGAMVGIYFKTNHLPVRYLIYVAMTALTRMLISDIQAHHPPDLGIVLASGAILLLAFATLVIRYGSSRFPSASAAPER